MEPMGSSAFHQDKQSRACNWLAAFFRVLSACYPKQVKAMGRLKKKKQEIQEGSLYVLDKRHYYFHVFQEIKSRQNSKNIALGNLKLFWINKEVPTTLLICKNRTFFGKKYLYGIITDALNQVSTGWITLKGFLTIITGKPKWIDVAVQ